MATAPGNLQWLRSFQLVIGKAGGSGIQIGSFDVKAPQLKVQFEIIKTVDSTPNTAQIKVFNLNPANEASLFPIGTKLGEFTEVLLNAGYQNASKLIFTGNVKHAFHYRDKADYVMQIEAADGDKDYRQAKLNLTLAAGTSHLELVNAAVGSFATTKLGAVLIKSQPRIRGRVISGMTRDVLSQLSRESTANWSIQDGQLQIVPTDTVLQKQAIVVNAATGMLKAPEINDRGIRVNCLLNPLIGINSVLQLNNNDIMQRIRKRRSLNANTRKDPNLTTVALNADGLYKVIRVDHRGDTRSTQWETESYCISLGSAIPQSDAVPLSQSELDQVGDGLFELPE